MTQAVKDAIADAETLRRVSTDAQMSSNHGRRAVLHGLPNVPRWEREPDFVIAADAAAAAEAAGDAARAAFRAVPELRG